MRGFIEVPVIVLRCKILNNTIQITAKHSLNSLSIVPVSHGYINAIDPSSRGSYHCCCDATLLSLVFRWQQ